VRYAGVFGPAYRPTSATTKGHHREHDGLASRDRRDHDRRFRFGGIDARRALTAALSLLMSGMGSRIGGASMTLPEKLSADVLRPSADGARAFAPAWEAS